MVLQQSLSTNFVILSAFLGPCPWKVVLTSLFSSEDLLFLKHDYYFKTPFTAHCYTMIRLLDHLKVSDIIQFY